jgi:hypothetical protein
MTIASYVFVAMFWKPLFPATSGTRSPGRVRDGSGRAASRE